MGLFFRLPGGGYVCTYTDVTERKSAEDALRAAWQAILGNSGRTIPGCVSTGSGETL